MSNYDNTNRGTLFKTKQKRHQNSPDMTGSINIDGKEYWLSAWTKTGRNGNQYLSLARGDVKVPNPPAPPSTQDPGGQTNGINDFDNDLPF